MEVEARCYLWEALLQPPLASRHNPLSLMNTNHLHRPDKTRHLQWLVR